MPTTTQTIILRPGESFTLPPGAELLFSSDPAGLTSDCELPPATSYVCGYFFIIVDADSNTGHSMDQQSTYAYVKFGDIQYDINLPITYGDPNSPSFTPITSLNFEIPDTTLFEFMAITTNEVTSRTHAHVYFRIPESFFDSARLGINNRGVNSIGEYPAYEAECEVYDDPA